jgi:hypothetical protein
MRGTTWTIEGQRLRTSFTTRIDSIDHYASHPSLDIAAFPIGIGSRVGIDEDTLRVSPIRYLVRSFVLPREQVSLGDQVYFLGFPGGLGSLDPISPVLRGGNIAWIDPQAAEFWIDAVSLGGNSGSPVFTAAGRELDLTPRPSMFIGMVFGHHGQRVLLPTVHEETLSIRIAATEIENWGLARAVWAKDILSVVEAAADLDH